MPPFFFIDPSPRPHIFEAIILFLLNHKDYEFLINLGVTSDVKCVDYIQVDLFSFL